MDETETYIKMVDCEEMQGNHELRSGDLFYQRLKGAESGGFIEGVAVEEVHNDYGSLVSDNSEKLVWLPYQHQLQEMILEKKQTTLLEPVAKLCLEFDEFIHPDNYCMHGDNRESGMFNHEYCQECVVKGNMLFKQFTSMEQLWLAFVQKELHNKVWDGEQWTT